MVPGGTPEYGASTREGTHILSYKLHTFIIILVQEKVVRSIHYYTLACVVQKSLLGEQNINNFK